MPVRHVDANKRGTPLYSVSARAGLTAAAAVAALLVAAGCSSTTTSASSAPATPASTPASTAAPTSGSTSASISVNDLNNSFSAMTGLKGVTSAGKGNVTVILPDTTSSTRYVEFDAPYLKQAFAA